MTRESKKSGGGAMMRFIRSVERVGNKLPHPMYIFLYLLIGCMVISAICAGFGIEVTYMAASADGTLAEATVAVQNLLSRSELQNFLGNIVNAYKSNAVLIPMLVCTFCITAVEETGFFGVALRRMLRGAPRQLATFMLCLAGVCANIAGDAGVILAISFGAILFKALGRNPWAGITIAYGSVQAGYGANLFPSTADALYAGISAPLAEPFGFVVHPMSNYIFLFACTWFLALAFTFVSEKFIVPLFGEASKESRSQLENNAIADNFVLTEAEHRGLKFAGIGALVFLAFLLVGMLPTSIFPAVFGFLRNPETAMLFPKSPFLDGMIPLIGLLFLAVGIPFGYGVGTIKNKGDIPPILQKGVNKMASLIFILFPCSLFVYQFNRSNLSTVISVGGERFLNSIHLTGLPMLVVFIIIVAFINIFMYSGSAKWMILAPIFVPMFANMSIHPAITQLAARIGDSCTNGLTPLNAALIAVLALMEQYRDPTLNPDKPGMGTVISSQIPMAITSFVVMTALFILFILADIPVGIGM